MNFAKKLFLGSVIAMGAFGIVACGDDSSSNTQQTVVDPTNPVNQRKDDIIALSNPDQMEGIDEIKFYGDRENFPCAAGGSKRHACYQQHGCRE